MAGFSNKGEVLHKIKAKLYPNYFKHVTGEYIARTKNNASLSVDQVCLSLKNRGGFSGSYDALQDNIKQFLDEIAYLICDGFSVNTGYFSIHPNVGGSFSSMNEKHNHKKNPVTFRFRTMEKLRRLAEQIEVEIEGVADGSGEIELFTNYDKESDKTMYSPGDQFCIKGYKIKISGEDESNGLYFVPIDDPSKAVKVTRIAENGSSRISGIAPKTGFARNRIEIRTQFTGSGSTMLKTPRIISSSFILEESSSEINSVEVNTSKSVKLPPGQAKKAG